MGAAVGDAEELGAVVEAPDGAVEAAGLGEAGKKGVITHQVGW